MRVTPPPPPPALCRAAFEISLGPLLWLILSELYPLSIRGVASECAGAAVSGTALRRRCPPPSPLLCTVVAVGSTANWFFTVSVTLLYPILKAAVGQVGGWARLSVTLTPPSALPPPTLLPAATSGERVLGVHGRVLHGGHLVLLLCARDAREVARGDRDDAQGGAEELVAGAVGFSGTSDA